MKATDTVIMEFDDGKRVKFDAVVFNQAPIDNLVMREPHCPVAACLHFLTCSDGVIANDERLLEMMVVVVVVVVVVQHTPLWCTSRH